MYDLHIEKKIGLQKKLIGEYIKTKNTKLLIPISKLGEEAILLISNLKCEKCGSENNLTIHHIITKQYKWLGVRYETQRKFYANLIVLCIKCHHELHKAIEINTMKAISQDTINKVKEKFEKSKKVNV